MSDGVCDSECNSLACLWDGDDCDGVIPPGGEKDHRPGFYQVILFDFVRENSHLITPGNRLRQSAL